VHLAGFEKEPGQLKAVADRVTQGTCGSVIRVLGCLTGKAKEEVLAAADCLVLPSYAEGLPIAILEAMAHGIPVIATTVGAIPEVITDGEQGFLIEPGDVQALTECMLKLSNDPELRKTMGLAARRRVEEEFSIDTMVERVMAVYREVLNERSRC